METNKSYIKDNFYKALKEGHIHAFFQPVIRTLTNKICNVEALARWIDPDRGLIAPMDLIVSLEKAGFIYDLDMEILRQTCAFYVELKQMNKEIHSFSVNLSRHDFDKPDLFERVDGILKEYGVDTDVINLEITESDMLNNVESFHRLFEKFTSAGYSFWIDDFGSGYSSLNMLKNYSFDVIKFDLQFLQDFSLKNRLILAPMINMAKNLGIHTLAEGVETKEQLKFLSSIGCEALQGFMFSKPISKKDFLAYIDSNPDILEPANEKTYWNQAGYLNYQSPTPLESYKHDPLLDNGFKEVEESPIALIEIHDNEFSYVYVSDAFLNKIMELGYDSIKEIEHAFNDKISDHYLMMKKLVMNSIGTGKVEELDYVNNNTYYTLKARCIARMDNKALLAIQLITFESDKKNYTTNEMIKYGNALFATFELVTIIHPKKDSSERIFSKMGIQSYASSKGLRESIRKFCENEVMKEDRLRYLAFFDMDTLEERVAKEGFIQDRFRMVSSGEWKAIRISRFPSEDDSSYLYTIQNMLKEENNRMDAYTSDHPEWRSI